MNKKITASDLIASLNADPAWVAARAKEETEREKRAVDWRAAEAPLVEELCAAGYNVTSAWDLVNTSAPYPDALPILLRHLERPYPGAVREGIARALAVPAAKLGWDTFVRLFREETDKRAKVGLAVAIANTADDCKLGDVIRLAADKHLGPSRKLLLSALERSRRMEARAALSELKDDPDLDFEIRNILRRRSRLPGG